MSLQEDMNLNEDRKAPLRGKDLSTKREMVVQYISATAKSVSEKCVVHTNWSALSDCCGWAEISQHSTDDPPEWVWPDALLYGLLLSPVPAHAHFCCLIPLSMPDTHICDISFHFFSSFCHNLLELNCSHSLTQSSVDGQCLSDPIVCLHEMWWLSGCGFLHVNVARWWWGAGLSVCFVEEEIKFS